MAWNDKQHGQSLPEAERRNGSLAGPRTQSDASSPVKQEKSSYLSFALMTIAATFGGLTQNIMNTALPSLMSDLAISVTSGQLLTTLFPLCMGVVIPTVAFLSRRFSSRSLVLASLALFIAGSLTIAVSESFTLIVIGRIMQGCATGILVPLVQVVVLAIYPQERWGLLMGIVGIAMGFAPNIGPTIGGAFTEYLGWRSCFWFLTIFSLALLVACLIWFHPRAIAEENPPRLDIASLLLSSAGFGCLLMGFSNAASYGFSSLESASFIVIGAIAIVFFCHRELHIPNPLLDLRTFKDRNFTVGTIMICLLFCAFIGITLVIPMQLQSVEHFSALDAGLVLLPSSIVAAIMSPLSGALVDRFGARPVSLLAIVALIGGTIMILDLGHCSDLGWIAGAQCVRQFGIASLIMPLTVWSVRKLTGHMTADGTTVSNALRQVAASLSTAFMVLLMAGGTAGGTTTAEGVNAAMMLSLVMAVAMFVIALAALRDA
ncbi:MAG: DHA2 family efflux MFS transporter permease subunit [Eggerthellaceae bacterium]|jgi:EmrB/QacA subfamily drug resistance transporter